MTLTEGKSFIHITVGAIPPYPPQWLRETCMTICGEFIVYFPVPSVSGDQGDTKKAICPLCAESCPTYAQVAYLKGMDKS